MTDLARPPWPAQFLTRRFTSASDRTKQVEVALQRGLNPAIRSLLLEQNGKLVASPARKKALDGLAAENVVFVVTGQQTGLFLGPLLTLYKILTAVRIAEELRRETDATVLPLFWLQSEDHDFDEINECVVFDQAGIPQRLSLSKRNSIALSSVQYETLDADVHRLLSVLREQLASYPGHEPLLEALSSAYLPGVSLVSAFEQAFAQILDKEPLLFLNPRDPRFAQLASPLYQQSLEREREITGLLLERDQQLRAAGFEPQVHVRADSPLVFFHIDHVAGPRHRLRRSADGWEIIGTGQTIGHDELFAFLRSDPLRFSSSALLRPIVQERLLPSAGYVGGPAEMSYFSQIDPLFSHFSLPAPVIYPRASFRLLEPKERRLLDKLSLSATAPDLASDLKEAALDQEGLKDFDDIVAQLQSAFGELSNLTAAADATLKSPTEKTAQKCMQQLVSLREKYSESLSRNRATDQERLEWLSHHLLPLGVDQERILSPLYFLAKYGIGVIEEIKKNIHPFDPTLREINL